MGVAKWQGQDNNIQQDNKSEYVSVFSNKNEGFLHDHVAKDMCAILSLSASLLIYQREQHMEFQVWFNAYTE